MNESRKEAYFNELEKKLPLIVYRNWKDWRFWLPISPRTMANEDSLGRGPKEKIMTGRVVGYPRSALIEWLRERSKVIR
jgi:predicted DNA-binding transcriptional regulator AlpA